MELVQAAAGVPTTNDADGDGGIPKTQGGPDRPLYEVHINSIVLREYLISLVPEIQDQKVPGFNLGFTLLSLVIMTALNRKK